MKFHEFVERCSRLGVTPDTDVAFIATLLDGPQTDFRLISVASDKVALVDNPPSREESG